MAELLSQFRNIDFVNYVGVEDFSDKLSFLYTTALLAGFAAMTTVRTYFLEPLSCYLPNTFGHSVDSQVDFVNNYCWTEGTYAVPVSEFRLNNSQADGGVSAYSDSKIVYYQWVPFVLAVQAACFYLPRLLWHIVSFDRAGTDVGHIVKVASDAARDNGEKHDRLVRHACRMIEQMLESNSANKAKAPDEGMAEKLRRRCWRAVSVVLPSRFVGNWLILSYLVIKAAYLANVLSQLVLMQQFLQLDRPQYSLMGANLLSDIVNGRDWQVSMVFPRVGCCAVFLKTGAVGNWQFSQCTLPINMINEKMYIFVWFWFYFVAAATVCSSAAWVWRLSTASMSNRFVKRMFKLADNYEEIKGKKHASSFARTFLRRDGTFILKMVALNCGDIVCSEIIQGLWALYCRRLGVDDDDDDEGAHCAHGGLLRLSCDNVPDVANAGRRHTIFGSLPTTRWRPNPTPTAPHADDVTDVESSIAEEEKEGAATYQLHLKKSNV